MARLADGFGAEPAFGGRMARTRADGARTGGERRQGAGASHGQRPNGRWHAASRFHGELARSAMAAGSPVCASALPSALPATHRPSALGRHAYKLPYRTGYPRRWPWPARHAGEFGCQRRCSRIGHSSLATQHAGGRSARQWQRGLAA